MVSIEIKDELHDPDYMRESEEFFGQPIIVIGNDDYDRSVDEVIRQERYMAGVAGARCTKELKKAVRAKYQRPDDIHVFGFDANEERRVDQVIDAEPELHIWPTLIEAALTKADCFALGRRQGLKLARMYELGYHNNNCVGCLKATGAGYWNKIRKDFPEVFAKRAAQEEALGVALCKLSENKFKTQWPDDYSKMKEAHEAGKVRWSKDRTAVRIPLRFLPENAGNHKDLEIGSCGFFCELMPNPQQ